MNGCGKAMGHRLPAEAPGVSVIVPVLHEERSINRCLAGLVRMRRSRNMEIVVVDGDPAESTLDAIGDGFRRQVRRIRAGRGRAVQMNAGAAAARGGILLFLHADTRLPSDACERIVRLLRDSAVSGGAFHLRFDGPERFLDILARLNSLRSRILREPFGDQAIFLRREIFFAAGGYPELPFLEEIVLMRRLRKAGKGIRIAPGCVVTSARRFRLEGPLTCFAKDLAIYLAHALGGDPRRLKRWYPDHGSARRNQTLRLARTRFQAGGSG